MPVEQRHTPLTVETIEPQMCTLDLRHSILRQLPFFAGLPSDAIEEIQRRFHEHGYAAGETIYLAGDAATHLHVVARGKVKVLRHSLSGQDVLLDILTPSEFFGTLSALGDAEYPDTAQALTQCCILAIAAEDFQAVLQRYPAVAVAALEIVTTRLRAAQEQVRQLSAHPAEQRVAATLLLLAQKLGEEHQGAVLLQVPLSREDLAAMTGAAVETVSRIMSQLRKAGIIRSGRQWVAIAHRERLAALAADTPG
ncbi:MAG: hypothetical protein RLZZ387_5496 [Chloroflexota bacterium]